MAFQIIQIIYWLALSTWFGGVMFIAIAAPVIFRTVRENDPVLTNVLSVNLEGQHATLLAGSIVRNLLVRLSQIVTGCVALLIIALIAQLFVADLSGGGVENNIAAAVIRWVLTIGAAGVTAYDRFVVWPLIEHQRKEYIDHADEPEIANPAKDAFDREHRRSMTLLSIVIALLLLLIMYSSNITPRKVSQPASSVHPTAAPEVGK